MINIHTSFCQSLGEVNGVRSEIVLVASDHTYFAAIEEGWKFLVFQE